MSKIKESLRLERDELMCKMANLALFKASTKFDDLDEDSKSLIETRLEDMKIHELNLQKRIYNLK